MQQESRWRLYLTGAVTLLCLLLFFPTMRYVAFLQFTKPPATDADPTVIAQYENDKAALQRKAIPLGLDLVGGVDVLLQIDEAKTRANRLNKQREEIVQKLGEMQIGVGAAPTPANDGLSITLADKENARQVIAFLDQRIEKDRDKPFSSYDKQKLQETGSTTLLLDPNYVRSVMRESAGTAERKIRDRVDKYGVTQPSVSVQPEKFSIRVQIPGEKDPKHVIDVVIQPAQLQFYGLYRDTKLAQDEKGAEHDALLMRIVEPTVEIDSRGEKHMAWKVKEGETMPSGYMLMPGRPLGRMEEAEMLKLGKSATPIGRGADGKSKETHVYIVKDQPFMDASDLRDAYVGTDNSSLSDPIYVGLTFGATGARDFARMSRDYLHDCMAIALDRRIYSAPEFRSVIAGGSGQITGHFNPQEAHDLAMVLKAGALPADLKVEGNQAIGPTLGAQSILDSTKALIVAAAVITAFMVVYYGTAGVISIVALVLNLLVIVACLNLFGATLTLSGIGGMILTIGMAVDGNVLIYERIREELAAGRSLRDAIRHAFHSVFIVILDSHLTVLLASFVLLQFGAGSVQGFALTMAFGLVANLFTNLTVTYALCLKWFEWTGKLSVGRLRMLHNPNLDFIGFRHVSFTISAVAVAAALIYLVARGGPDMAVDFKGGVLTEVRVQSDQDESQNLAKILDPQDTGEAKVAHVTETNAQNAYIVRFGLLKPAAAGAESAGQSPAKYTQDYVENTLKKELGDKVEILSTTAVSSEVGQSFQEIAVIVIVATSLCILAFLWFRFELVFGVAAVVALIHDLIITLGIMVLMDFQVSLDVVSALLILLGFSTNDTIVEFDRIRENSHTMFGASFKTICNDAMNKMLGRTLITSGTVIMVMVVMYLMGGRSLQPFAMVMVIGGVVGTYSSAFVAAPMVYWWNERQKGKLVEQLGRSGAGPQVEARSSAGGESLAEGPAAAAGVAAQTTVRRGRR